MGGYYNNKGKGKGTPKGGKSGWEGYERYDDGKGKGKTRGKGYGKGKDEKGKGPETDYYYNLYPHRNPNEYKIIKCKNPTCYGCTLNGPHLSKECRWCR